MPLSCTDLPGPFLTLSIAKVGLFRSFPLHLLEAYFFTGFLINPVGLIAWLCSTWGTTRWNPSALWAGQPGTLVLADHQPTRVYETLAIGAV
jgi:hypothetical protein